MAENQKFQCSGNCLNCAPAQRGYCASQHAYSNMKVLDKMMEAINKIAEKIEAIQNSEACVFDPYDEEHQPTKEPEAKSSAK